MKGVFALCVLLLVGTAVGQQGSTIPLYPVNERRTLDLEYNIENLGIEFNLTPPFGRGRWVVEEQALYFPHGVSEGSRAAFNEDGVLEITKTLDFNTTSAASFGAEIVESTLVMQEVDAETGVAVPVLHWVHRLEDPFNDVVTSTNYEMNVINSASAHTKRVTDYFFTRTTTGGPTDWVVFASRSVTSELREIGVDEDGVVTDDNAAWFDADGPDTFSVSFVIPLVVRIGGSPTPGAFFLDENSDEIVYAQLKAGAKDNYEGNPLEIDGTEKQITACVADALYEFESVYCAIRNDNGTNSLARVPALSEDAQTVRVSTHIYLGPGGPITSLYSNATDSSIFGVTEADDTTIHGLSTVFAVDNSDIAVLQVIAVLPIQPLVSPVIVGVNVDDPGRNIFVTGDDGELVVVNWASYEPTLTSYVVSIAVFVAAAAALIWAVLLLFLGASAATLRAVPYASNTYRWMGVKYNEFQTKRRVAQLKRLKNKIVQTRSDVQDARVEVQQAENKRLIAEQERKIEEQERKLDEARKKQRRTQHFHGKLPYIVERLVTFLDTPRFLNEEGLFRLSGVASDVRELRDVLLDGEDVDLSVVQDPHTAAGALKLYFRENPEPLMTFDLLEDWLRAQNTADKPSRVKAYQKVIDRLPRANRRVAGFVIGFLKRVSEKKSKNKMGPQNLATVFGPNFWRSQNEQLGGFTPAASILIDLIEHYPSFRW